MAQKRKYYVESQKKLKKIKNDIEKDDQITKIVKEDNIKNIDNILESQGIKTANIEVDKEPGNQSAKNLSYKPQNNTNLFGAPPNFDKKPSNQNQTKNKQNLNASTKTNLFGSTQPSTNKAPTAKTNNLFGSSTTAPKKQETTSSNLFGNTSTSTKKADAATKNNLFGNPNANKKPATNNLFGTPTQTQNRNTNLFGNQPQQQKQTQPPKQNQQQQNKDLNVSLKLDPKQGTITGVNVQGNIDPKDAYNFYQKNKQYMPSGQQMLSGAQAGMNFYNQNNANNNNSKQNSGLANLFGTKK